MRADRSLRRGGRAGAAGAGDPTGPDGAAVTVARDELRADAADTAPRHGCA